MVAKQRSVRNARPEDAASIASLWRTFVRDTPAGDERPPPSSPPSRRFRELLGKPDHLWVIVEAEGLARGFVHARLSMDDDGVPVDPFVEIATLVVARSHRRLGLGRSLVLAVERWARTRRAATVRLVVHDSNPGAIALYQQCGFITWMRMMEWRLTPIRRH